MPVLGMNQETGRVIAWLKREGETVVKGEPLMEVETDKATVEIESPASGVLAQVTARAGDEVPVGTAVAQILGVGESAVSPASAEVRTPASPKARRLARELGFELSTIGGSGPGGAVKAADLPSTPPPAVERALSGIWATMARRTTESWQQVPHFYLEREVDAGRLLSWREAAAKADPQVTISDLLVRLVAAVLVRHPKVNCGAGEAHVGLAVAVEDGLVVPVIHDAQRLSLVEISRARSELVERARGGKLRPEDLEGGTFTISNLGMFAVDAFSAIVNQPQAAILATGRIADRVVAGAGVPIVRPTMRLTLSFDHRAVDGARGAAFLTELGDLVEEPAALL